MTNAMAFLYQTEHRERLAFGKHYCGPATLPHVTETEIARYVGTGDGHDVRVTCSAWPARFYTIHAAPRTKADRSIVPGFVLETGSGAGEWAAETAKLIADGMIMCSVRA